MSDSQQGPGWWQASDGKWYPPESHPDAAPLLRPPAPPAPVQSYHDLVQQSHAASQKKRKKPIWRRWWAIALAILVLIIVIAAVAAPKEDDAATNDASSGQIDSAGDDASSPSPQSDASGDEDQGDGGSVGSRDNPVPLGQSATIKLDTFGDADNSIWTISADAAGSDITQAVLDENQFNEQPGPGTLFYGVPVTLTLTSADKEPLSIFVNLSLDFFGPSSLSVISDGFSEGCGVTPNEFDVLKEVFVGGSVSGTVCYQVTSEDAAGGILLTTDDIDGDRLFLATR